MRIRDDDDPQPELQQRMSVESQAIVGIALVALFAIAAFLFFIP